MRLLVPILTVCIATLVLGTIAWAVFSTLLLLRSARADGVPISILTFIGLRLRNRHHSGPDPVRAIVDTARRASLAGLGVTLAQIETQTLAGGDPALCVDALIAAWVRGMQAGWNTIIAMDLAGYDPLAAVEAGADLRRVVGGPEYAGMFRKSATTATKSDFLVQERPQ